MPTGGAARDPEVPDALLMFIEGTICDTRHRHGLIGLPGFHDRELMRADTRVQKGAACLQELACACGVLYIGARPTTVLEEPLAGLEGAAR